MEIHVSPCRVVDVFYPYKYGYRYTHPTPPTPRWVYTDTLKILVIRITCHAVPSLYSFLEVLLSPWQDWQVFSECYVWIVLWGNFFPCLILVKNILSISGCPLQFASIWFPKGFNTFTFMSSLCWDFVDFLFFQLSSLASPPPPPPHFNYIQSIWLGKWKRILLNASVGLPLFHHLSTSFLKSLNQRYFSCGQSYVSASFFLDLAAFLFKAVDCLQTSEKSRKY